MSEKDLRLYYLVFTDCWKLLKDSLQNPDNSDEFMQSIAKKAEEIYEKHGKKKFVKEQVLSVINEIDRIVTEKKNE